MARVYARKYPTLADQMAANAHRPHECWEWRGHLMPNGYGVVTEVRRPSASRLAHRNAYELATGPIPDGSDLDHLCRNRRCFNPSHLEPVTRRENLLRGSTGPALNARKTHCKHGHPFTPTNTTYRRNGKRECRQCNRIRCRRRYHATRSEK